MREKFILNAEFTEAEKITLLNALFLAEEKYRFVFKDEETARFIGGLSSKVEDSFREERGGYEL